MCYFNCDIMHHCLSPSACSVGNGPFLSFVAVGRRSQSSIARARRPCRCSVRAPCSSIVREDAGGGRGTVLLPGRCQAPGVHGSMDTVDRTVREQQNTHAHVQPIVSVMPLPGTKAKGAARLVGAPAPAACCRHAFSFLAAAAGLACALSSALHSC